MLLRDDLAFTEEQTRKFLQLMAESAQRLADVPDRLEQHSPPPTTPLPSVSSIRAV